MTDPLDDLVGSDPGDDHAEMEDEESEEEENAIPWVELAGLDGPLAAFYDPETVCVRLRRAAAGEELRAVTAELAVRCGSPPQPLLDGACCVFRVTASSPLAQGLDVEALQAELRPRGALVLRGHAGGGDAGGEEPVLTLLPTADPLEALAAVGVGGPSQGVSSGHVVEFFRTHPAVLGEIGPGTVTGRFDPLPDNAWALAVEVYNLCPDTVEQGEGGFEGLIAGFEQSGAFCLRWV